MFANYSSWYVVDDGAFAGDVVDSGEWRWAVEPCFGVTGFCLTVQPAFPPKLRACLNVVVALREHLA